MSIEGVKKCLPTLKKLAKARTRKQRDKILAETQSCIFYAISEISKNTLNGNITLSDDSKKKLNPYRIELRKLSKKSIPLKKRKEIVYQSGGAFLPALLWPAISYLGGKLADKFI